jgi:hypothetical protein
VLFDLRYSFFLFDQSVMRITDGARLPLFNGISEDGIGVPMNRIIAALALAFAVAAGTVTAMTLQTQPAYADGSNCNGC